MGMGIGIDCVRCGRQLAYEQPDYFDEDNKLCGYCVRDLKKAKWDQEHSEIIQNI